MKPTLQLHVLDREKVRFTERERQLLLTTVAASFDVATKSLKLPNLMNITVYGDGENAVPETGEGGYTASADWIQLSLDPKKRRQWPRIIKNVLPSTVLHELHHASREFQIGARTTLADDVLTEGLATVFSMEQFPEFTPPWSVATDAQAKRWLKWMSADWNRTEYQRFDYFFKKGPNRWAGYKLGTWLVHRAKKETGKSAADMAAWSAGKMLEAAK